MIAKKSKVFALNVITMIDMITKDIFKAIRKGDVLRIDLSRYLEATPNHIALEDYKHAPVQRAVVSSRNANGELTLELPNECLVKCNSHIHVVSIDDFQPDFDVS